jgi:hypothetical protein
LRISVETTKPEEDPIGIAADIVNDTVSDRCSAAEHRKFGVPPVIGILSSCMPAALVDSARLQLTPSFLVQLSSPSLYVSALQLQQTKLLSTSDAIGRPNLITRRLTKNKLGRHR